MTDQASRLPAKAIILSAGQGRRLLPLTENTPKCLLPVSGKPVIAWQIDTLLANGIQEIVIVAGFQIGKVEALMAERYQAYPAMDCAGGDEYRFPVIKWGYVAGR